MDDDGSAGAEVPGDKLSKIARGEPLTAAEEVAAGGRELLTERLTSEYLESPVKMARELYESPAAKLIRDYANSPSQQLANQIPLGHSPAFGAGGIARMETIGKMFEPSVELAAQLNAIQPLALDYATLASIGAFMPSIDPNVIAAIQGVQPFNIDPLLTSAVSQAQRTIEEAMATLGGIGSAMKPFEEQNCAVYKSLFASLAGPFGDIAKTLQWASTLGRIDTSEITKLLGGNLGTAVDDIRSAIAGNLTGLAALDQAKISGMLGLTARFEADFAATQFKMSALAGIGEVFDRRSHFRLDAYHSLFGEWRTRVDLPECFWCDGAYASACTARPRLMKG